MKIKTLAMLGMMIGAPAALAETPQGMLAAGETHDVTITIGDVYVPNGFDAGADAFVVVNGMFPNTCYEWKEAQVAAPAANLHEIRSIARVKEGMCLMMLVPFTHEIELGRLERGTHTLRFMNGDGTYIEKTLNVQ